MYYQIRVCEKIMEPRNDPTVNARIHRENLFVTTIIRELSGATSGSSNFQNWCMSPSKETVSDTATKQNSSKSQSDTGLIKTYPKIEINAARRFLSIVILRLTITDEYTLVPRSKSTGAVMWKDGSTNVRFEDRFLMSSDNVLWGWSSVMDGLGLHP